MAFHYELGLEIDDKEGLAREDISCSNCGRTYKQQRKICKRCGECATCCSCENPQIVSAKTMIRRIHRGYYC
jgi:hypothetical protein